MKKKNKAKSLIGALLCIAMLLGVLLITASCRKEDEPEYALVNKTEFGLNFTVRENYVRSYTYGFDIEYSSDEVGFFVDLMPYSDYELSYGADIQTCTKKIIEVMKFGGVEINYNAEKKTSHFDAWVANEEDGESYYNYIVVLLSKNGIFIARYVCAGTDQQMQKHSADFAEMAKHLSVVDM